MTSPDAEERGGSFLTCSTKPGDAVTPDDLGEEERMLVQAVMDFAEREVEPAMGRLLERDPETSRGLFGRAAELGIFMAEVPEEDGGMDLNVLAVTGMLSTRANLGPLGPMILGHQGIGTLPIVYFGTPAQKERYLGPCMEGALLSAFALTEPSTGSDAMDIRTKAVLSSDRSHYVLRGSKQWITNASWADLFILFAKVDGEHFTAFIVERESPGLVVGEPERLLGQHGSCVCALSLEEVRVPVENVLGEVGKGHKVAFCTLNMGRLKLAASSATGAKIALEAAARYAAERVQFGLPIAKFGLIKRKLADMAARAYAAEAVAYRTAGLVYRALEALAARGAASNEARLATLTEFSAECALAKVYASEAYNALADEALQVFGGYGFSEEYLPAKLYRDSRITRIYEGTNEICRIYAQRRLYKTSAVGVEVSSAAETPLLEAAARLKRLYLSLADETLQRIGVEGLRDPDHQQLLASLADIAMEIYASESVALRVAKLAGAGAGADRSTRDGIVTLVIQRSAERIRNEARALLSELRSGEALAGGLREVEAALPAAGPLIEVRGAVADAVVASEGRLPGDT